MKVLIGCESSGAIRDCFREKGHEAYSCDLTIPLGLNPRPLGRGASIPVDNPYHIKIG